MPLAKDEAGNTWEVDANGNPIRLVSQAQSAPRPIPVSGPPPTQGADVVIRNNEAAASGYDPAQSAANVRSTNAQTTKTGIDAQGSALDNQVTAATMPNVIQKSYWDATAAERQAMTAGLPQGMMWGPNGQPTVIPNAPKTNSLTPVQRKEAMDAYADAQALRRQADEWESAYQQGPAQTKGLMGLMDFLPTDANRLFDTKGQKGRAYVKKTLGFTGGEGNTVTEAGMLYDPYLPKASDRDVEIEDKIASARQLADDAEAKAIATLGGVPDANGNIVPYNPRGRSVDTKSLAAEGGLRFSAGKKGVSPDALHDINGINSLIASGASYDEVIGWMEANGRAIPWSGEEGNANKAVFRNQIQRRDKGFKIKPLSVSSPAGFDEEEGSFFEKMRAKFLNTGVGAATLNAADAGSLGLVQAVSPDMAIALDVTRSNSPLSSLGGTVLGGLTGGAGLNKVGGMVGSQISKRAPTVAGAARGLASKSPRAAGYAKVAGEGAAYGGIYGANTGEGALEGAAMGATGGLLGKGATSGLGRLTRGVSDPAVQMLNDRGIPMTFGQILGNRGPVGRMANKLESLPLIGDMIAGQRGEGIKRFGIEAMKDAVEPVGGKIGGDDLTAALQQAQGAVSQGYTDALSGVNLKVDSQLANDYARLAQRLQDEVMPYSPETGGVVQSVLRDDLAPLFGKTGELDGGRMQQAFQTLQGARSGLPNDHFGGKAKGLLSDATGSLEGLLGRQDPAALSGYQAANQAFRNVRPIEQVMASRVQGGASQAFTPTQLAQAVTSNTKKFGGLGAAARGANKTPLMEAGEQVLPPTVPNSGSADRGFAGMLLPAALGGSAIGTETLGDNTPLAATLAALAALSTKTGGKAAQKGLVSRTDSLRRLGGSIGNQQDRIGMFGGRLLPLLSTF